MPTEPENQQFGRYEVIRRIARGGMGELYLARSSGTGGWEKRVAIKTVLPHLSNQVESVTRFVDEARISTTLTHGNIVQVFDFDQNEDGAYFIVMEFVDGWDLRWLLKAAKNQDIRVSEPLAIFIAAEMCCGLDYAHQRTDESGQSLQIVHRDITPSNVLIARNGEVKLTDFGIAAARDRFEQTVTGELRGKFGYMSPEQAAGESVDPRSDIFSVGIVLFEMLTGERPFDGESDMDTLSRVQKGRRPRIRELLPDVSEDLERIVERALAFSVGDRFDSAEQMQVALLALLYRDTQPVTDRQLSRFCQSIEDAAPSEETSDGKAPSFDTLLRRQLERPSTPGSGGGTGGGSQGKGANGSRGSANTAPSGSHSLPAMGPVISPDETRTIGAMNQRRTRRQRRRWQVFGIVSIIAVAVAALLLSYRAGQQGSILPTTLRVETKPTGARVYVDGTPFGLTTLIERVKPGVHILQINHEGYLPVQRTVTAGPNRLTRVAMHLIPESPAEIIQTYTTVQFFVEPGDGVIRVGDNSVRDGETLVVPIGEQLRVQFEAEGYESLEFEHTFVRGEDRLVRRLDASSDTEASERAAAQRRAAIARQAAQRQNGTRNRTRSVALRGVPTGASVHIDGQSLGDVRTVELPRSGTADIRIDAPGYHSLRRSVSSDDWADGELQLRMDELTRGWLTIRFVGDVMLGQIAIDGNSLGENRSGPSARFELTEGRHSLRVVNEATGHQFERQIVIRESADEVVAIDWRIDETQRAPE